MVGVLQNINHGIVVGISKTIFFFFKRDALMIVSEYANYRVRQHKDTIYPPSVLRLISIKHVGLLFRPDLGNNIAVVRFPYMKKIVYTFEPTVQFSLSAATTIQRSPNRSTALGRRRAAGESRFDARVSPAQSAVDTTTNIWADRVRSKSKRLVYNDQVRPCAPVCAFCWRFDFRTFSERYFCVINSRYIFTP